MNKTSQPPRWAWLLGPIALLAMLLPWAYASPVGSSADENYHLTYIWCVAGDSPECKQTLTQDGRKVVSVVVPATVGKAPCFVGDSQADATCALDGLPEGSYESSRFSSNSSYPPPFYRALHSFVGEDVERSVIQMRMFNSLIASVVLALAIWVAAPRVRAALGISWTIGLIPFGLFYIPSVNPSSWAIIGSSTFWVFLTTVLNRWNLPLRKRAATITGLAVSTLLALARGDQAWVLLLSFIAILFVSRKWQARKRVVLVSLAVVGSLSVVGAWLFNVGRYVRSLEFSWPQGNSQTDQPNPLVKLLVEFPYFLTGHLGTQQPWSQRDSVVDFGVEGWTNMAFRYGLISDIQMPSLVGMVGTFLAGAVAFLALSRTSRLRFMAPVIIVIGILVQVLVMRSLAQWGSWESSQGAFWFAFPRYTVPAFMVLLAMLVMARTTHGPMFNRKQRALAASALAVSATVSLMAVMSRYMYGQDHSWLQFETYRGWWWNFGPDPVAVIGLSALGAAVYFAVMLSLGTSTRLSTSNKGPSQQDYDGSTEYNNDEGAPVQTSRHKSLP